MHTFNILCNYRQHKYLLTICYNKFSIILDFYD